MRQLPDKLRAFVNLKTVAIVAAVSGSVVFGVVLLSSIGRVQKDFHQLHKTPTEEAKREFDASVEAVKAIVGGIGTIATIIGGIVLYKNFKVADEKQVTERFTQAINQLGSDKLEVRLGGIYALERIARDSPKDHWTIMEVLCSFVREKSLASNISTQAPTKQTFLTSFLLEQQPNKNPEKQSAEITTDVQAALTVIGRRDPKQNQSGKLIDLSGANLSGANLSSADLSGANLNSADLSGVNLSYANLSGAFLHYGNLSYAKPIGANFSGANLYCANLSNAHFLVANLSSAYFYGSNLSKSLFIKANLSGAQFIKANLSGADFAGSDLSGAYFGDVDLSNTCFGDVDLSGADLSDDQLKNALLCGTTLANGTTSDRDCDKLVVLE